MKKIIPFLVSGILMVGAVACQQDVSKTSDAGATNEAPATTASEATSKNAENAKTTATTTGTKATTPESGAEKGGVKTIVKNRLEEKFPGSKLAVEETNGVITVKGTVPNEATLKKIEPAVKEYKFQGVKSVKVEATVAGKKP